MKTFKDNLSRTWECNVTTSALQRIRAGTGMNIGDANVLQQTIPRLLLDDLFAVEAAWCVVQPQALKNGITEESFVDSMSGDVIGPAAEAIRDGLTDFFRKPGIRNAVRLISDQATSQMDRALAGVQANLSNPATSSNTSTESQESSASTPAR